MNLNHKTNYAAGDQLTADAWNKLAADVNELGTKGVGGGGSTSTGDSGYLNVSSKGNVELSSPKNINIEPAYVASGGAGTYGDISFKPGDDIEFLSHHRETGKQDEISLKVHNGDTKKPVRLQVNAADVVLTTKDKVGSDANVFDVRVNANTGTRGYLKVRAQAIDLRSESHGGIALQPKGHDGSGNMNKIKFEHGGGDGLEFGTFNTEKTSLFTDEYRFNKNGIWKMATRTPIARATDGTDSKYQSSDSTTHYTYEKQPDDFYDEISDNDETATTNAIIKTAHALNDGKNRHAKYTEKLTNKGVLKKTLELETVVTIKFAHDSLHPDSFAGDSKLTIPDGLLDPTKEYTISDFKDIIKGLSTDDVAQKYGTAGDSGVTLSNGDVISCGGLKYVIVEHFAPSIDITAGEDLSLDAKEGTLSLGGNIVEFGSDIIELGEMEDGLYAQYKLTKKNNAKPCDLIKIKAINNQANPLTFDSDAGTFAVDSFYPGSDETHPASVQIPGKLAEPTTDAEATQHIQVVAQCKLMDVVKFVAWAKNNNFGPWANE